jgi:hypothetical protein
MKEYEGSQIKEDETRHVEITRKMKHGLKFLWAKPNVRIFFKEPGVKLIAVQ